MSGDFGKQQFQQKQFKHKASDMAQKGVDHDSIREELKIPAKGLLFSGILSIVLVLACALGGLVYGSAQTETLLNNLVYQMYGESDTSNGKQRRSQEDLEKIQEQRQQQANSVLVLSIGAIVIAALVLASFYVCAVAGGVLMGQLRNYKLCRLACILALIPVISPLIVVGIPFGIMGLAKLKKPKVRKAFT